MEILGSEHEELGSQVQSSSARWHIAMGSQARVDSVVQLVTERDCVMLMNQQGRYRRPQRCRRNLLIERSVAAELSLHRRRLMAPSKESGVRYTPSSAGC